ncbi:hypothetical protein Tsubulata_050170 [Turnera subulata]|uniref:Uncharacterized protein n=1 Tax=Turnera subulata TaxID=218843 RepID=A0A9Q0FE12_9ROSI|nr:hypothetical protein Tsubulata_050170 [Turnera subulata]
MASRYTSYDSRSSTTSSLSSSSTSLTPSRALVKSKPSLLDGGSKGRSNTAFTTTVKKLMQCKKTSSSSSSSSSAKAAPGLVLPPELQKAVAAHVKGTTTTATTTTPTSSPFMTLQKKLFGKENLKKKKEPKALTESKPNTRTLAMVLRSERELLTANKELEMEVDNLKSMLETKNREVEKLKDLCLKQKEEIKSLKSSILFPDVMGSGIQDIVEKQGLELRQAKQLIPNLQRQVTSLTGQLHSLAQDLAEVKADKYAKSRSQLTGSSRQTSSFNYEETTNSLEFSSSYGTTPGSPDGVLLEDFNPCLTPYGARRKSQVRGIPSWFLNLASASKDLT